VEREIRVQVSTAPRPIMGPTKPPVQWVSGIKRRRLKVDYSPPPVFEVQNYSR
jgi:hypothetical protein